MKKLTIRALLFAAAAVVAAAPAARRRSSRVNWRSAASTTSSRRTAGGGLQLRTVLGARVGRRGLAALQNGQWIYTQYGWTWVSSTRGAATRTTTGPGPRSRLRLVLGAGTVWAPAWVTWSYSKSYVGWAPLPPTVVFGASGYSGRPIVSGDQYVFVPTNRFIGRNVTPCASRAAERGDLPSDAARDGLRGLGRHRPQHRPADGDHRAASGRRIETTSIQAARPPRAPRPRRGPSSHPRRGEGRRRRRPQTAIAHNAPAEHGNRNVKPSRAPDGRRSKHRVRRPRRPRPPIPSRTRLRRRDPRRARRSSRRRSRKHPPADEKPEKPEMQARHAAPPPAAHHSEPAQRPEPNAAEVAAEAAFAS